MIILTCNNIVCQKLPETLTMWDTKNSIVRRLMRLRWDSKHDFSN